MGRVNINVSNSSTPPFLIYLSGKFLLISHGAHTYKKKVGIHYGAGKAILRL